MTDFESLETTLERMCAEYLEMPGLRLTVSQARRLWGLDESTCVLLLNALVDNDFLRVTREGIYTRATDGPAVAPRVRMAKAAIRPSLPAAQPRW